MIDRPTSFKGCSAPNHLRKIYSTKVFMLSKCEFKCIYHLLSSSMSVDALKLTLAENSLTLCNVITITINILTTLV